MLVTLKAQVSEEAAKEWDRFLTQNGVTLGAYLQATAERFAEGGEQLGIAGQNVLELARTITAERRKRGGPRS